MSDNMDMELVELRKNMRRVNFALHFTRNRSNHTQYYYHRLISIIGYERWKKLPPEIRRAWDSASQSFDRQYGMIKAWAEKPVSIEIPENVDAILNSIERLKSIQKALERIEKQPVQQSAQQPTQQSVEITGSENAPDETAASSNPESILEIADRASWQAFVDNLPPILDRETLLQKVMDEIVTRRGTPVLRVYSEYLSQMKEIAEGLISVAQRCHDIAQSISQAPSNQTETHATGDATQREQGEGAANEQNNDASQTNHTASALSGSEGDAVSAGDGGQA